MLFGLLSWTTLGWLVVVGCFAVIGKWVTNSNAGSAKQGTGPQRSRPSAGGASYGGASGFDDGPDGYGEDHDEGSSSTVGDTVRLQKIKVEGASGEIARILGSVNHYEVLEIARDVPTVEIKRAYRIKQMATHPDKNHGVPGAKEASQRVNAAYDRLGDEIRRKQYDVSLADEEKYGPRSGRRAGGPDGGGVYFTPEDVKTAFEEWVKEQLGDPPPGAYHPCLDPGAYDMFSDEPNHTFRMSCECSFDHMATKVPERSAYRARLCYCSNCNARWLPARNGDVWFECSSGLGRLFYRASPDRFIKAYRCVGNYVYDITPWARCQGLISDSRGNPAPCNSHYVPFRMSDGSGGAGSRQQADKRNREKDPNYGYNQFKGKGVNSHKTTTNNKKKKKRH